MATKTQVTIQDDLDGTPEAQSVGFGLDGRAYEIDLSPKNKAKLDEALRRSLRLDEGCLAGRVPTQKRAGGSGLDREQFQALRDWAAAQGIEIAARGRIAISVIDAYKAVTERLTGCTARCRLGPRIEAVVGLPG
jgi:hypothetical protein